ncbi:hypothetical protein P7K49_003239, partial [Saguinus oedipus]
MPVIALSQLVRQAIGDFKPFLGGKEHAREHPADGLDEAVTGLWGTFLHADLMHDSLRIVPKAADFETGKT